MEDDKLFLNEFIEKNVNKNRKIFQIMGIIFAIVGIGILALFLGDGSPKDTGDTVGGFFVILFFSSLGLFFIIQSLRTKVEKNEVYNSINGDTNDVVWIYDSITNRSGRSFYEISFGMKTGKTIKFSVKDQEEQVAVRNRFRNVCNHAKVGYSTEREIAFKKNPTNFQ